MLDRQMGTGARRSAVPGSRGCGLGVGLKTTSRGRSTDTKPRAYGERQDLHRAVALVNKRRTRRHTYESCLVRSHPQTLSDRIIKLETWCDGARFSSGFISLEDQVNSGEKGT